LNIEIISEGTSGFLGLRAKKAKIKAGLLIMDNVLTGSYNIGGAKEEETLPREKQEEKEEDHGIMETAPVSASVSAEETPPAAKPEPVLPEENIFGEDHTVSGKMGDQAKEFLEGILARMSIPCLVTLEETPDKIFLKIQGDGGGLLIGKRGKNLDALQYIVNKAVNLTGHMKKMVTIDTETYRERREVALVSLAQKLAEKAKRIQKPITLNHMNAHNRRVIHLTLKDDSGVTTKSRGEGEFRKIVIIPVRKDGQSRHNDGAE
jgi:spoIIIJ-associated protein